MTLTDFMDSLGTERAFKPEPFLDASVDTLTMYFENTSSFAERVDKVLTVFKSFDTQEVIGFELKGVLRKMREIGAMISVVKADTPKVHIKLIIMAYMVEAKEDRGAYEEIFKRSSDFDAKLPVEPEKLEMAK